MPGYHSSSSESSSSEILTPGISSTGEGGTTQELTSVAEFLTIMEPSGIPGPMHFQRARLRNETFYEEFAPPGSQFGVYREIQNTREGVIMKRALTTAGNDSRNPQLQQQLKMVEREVRALCHAKVREHQNIVKLKAWAFDYTMETPETLIPVLFMEEAKCTLLKFLQHPHEFDIDRLDYHIRYSLCLDIASGLRRLFECGIVHGDLKPDNILMFYGNNQWVAKISDFGLSIFPDSEGHITYSMFKSTVGWKPPEVVDPPLSSESLPEHALFKCDSYSYGLLALSILVFQGESVVMKDEAVEYPECDVLIRTVHSAISSSSQILASEKSLQKEICGQICKKCLCREPRDRIIVSPNSFAIDIEKEVWQDW
ncbi:ankyrin repeat protein [Apiospora kogelbergensis]|uniref:ankyrin repeat protein n=1 Tax=Apiospora kogelbergensis TaxID=1337665 RepID=UPI003131940F